MKYLLTSCLALALILTPTLATAEEKAKDKDKEIEKAPLDDQFLLKAAVGNHAVTKLAELVEARSENTKVEDFAKQILADHKQASDKLGELIKNRKLGVVVGLDKECRDELDRLSKLKGNDFDKAFLDTFIREHEKCLKMVKGQTSEGKEATTVAFAKEALPKVEDHIKRAKELRNSLGN